MTYVSTFDSIWPSPLVIRLVFGKISFLWKGTGFNDWEYFNHKKGQVSTLISQPGALSTEDSVSLFTTLFLVHHIDQQLRR